MSATFNVVEKVVFFFKKVIQAIKSKYQGFLR